MSSSAPKPVGGATSSSNPDAGDLLCLILDLNPLAWALCSQPDATSDSTTSSTQSAVSLDQGLTLDKALDMMTVFVNAHLSLAHENDVSVFVSCGKQSEMLLSTTLLDESTSALEVEPTTAALSSSTKQTRDDNDNNDMHDDSEGDDDKEAQRHRDSNIYQQFKFVDDRLVKGVKRVMDSADSVNQDFASKDQSGLVGALSKALCHINRLNANTSLKPNLNKPRPRVVIMSVSEDSSAHYVSVMNCIFTAQKNSVPVDVCKIFGRDAVFLQQACHLTQGNYFRLARRSGLLQYLLMAFLPGPSARKHFIQPTHDQVDLRAACFCHRKIVDIGYVCSVCLSIFCSPLPVCSTCRTKFPMSTLKRLGFGGKPTTSSTLNGPRTKKRKVAAPPGSNAIAAVAHGNATPVIAESATPESVPGTPTTT
ncbi:RNA polymerase II transcription factor B subunit 4 [Microbotryomycetes sp. JL221]|nr:RNA polymerase II transcription factor B subunit 4 [Microbotryomycetes sp. JL221]